MSASRLSQFCERALEIGWLVGVTITPVFFNVYSSRVFEPDKLTTLRALALVMAVLWLVRYVEERFHKGESLRLSLKTPLVLPALLTMVVYLISTAFSIVPFTSLIGSYQRLQGTFTLFGYLVLFFAILTGLRTRVQLSRLITVLILNSLPISLYGIIQHRGLDPLPWAGDVTSRVAANMGNAIFVAAYLIMVVPLTASRIVQSFSDILERAEARTSDVLRASGYIFILAVQLLTIWYSRSRGPWLGVVASAFLFPYLALIVLQRQGAAREDVRRGRLMDILKGLAFGLGTLGLAAGLVGVALWALDGALAIYIGLGLAALVFGGLWLYFIVERRGWHWLWIGWGSVGLAIAGVLVAMNVPGPIQTEARKIPSLVRLTTITELQQGTGKVRGLIWQGTVDLISRHDPIKFPDGSVDRLNWLRPLVGYGPESMYVAYNSFYPPELGHYESRTASPDRSHNETLDSLVITGILGLATYLFTFGSFFAWGFHWLGLLSSRRQLLTYIGLDVFCAVLFFLIGWRLEGAYLFAVAIPLGVLVGTMVYLTWQAFKRFLRPEGLSDPEDRWSPHPHTVLIIGLLTGVVAHFVEINFGIAIAATRTTFWAYAALLVVLGLRWLPGLTSQVDEVPEIAQAGVKSKRQRSTRWQRQRRSGAAVEPWLASVLAFSLVAMFLLGTLAFDFVNNAERLGDGWQIFVRSLTMKYYPEPTRAYGALMVFVFTWVMFGVVGLGEFDREGLFGAQRGRRWATAVGVYGTVSVLGMVIFGLLLSGTQAALSQVQVNTLDEVVDVADRLTGLLGRYYGLIFVVLAVGGWVLMRENARPRSSGGVIGYGLLVVALVLSIPIIRDGSYNLVRADTIFKQGGVYANSQSATEKQLGIQHFERAIEYAPHEDYYHLFLGKALLELAQGLPEGTTPDEREAIFKETEGVLMDARALNPLNTDHSANLARFYKSWAARITLDLQAEVLDDQQASQMGNQRLDLLNRSLENYQTALRLSPNNPILWNELAQLYAVDFGNLDKFEETVARSLEIDEEFEQTWMLVGDLRRSQGDYDEAIEAYQRSLEIKDSCAVRRVIGTLLAQLSRWSEAVASLTVAIEACPKDAELWEMYRVLAIAYANQGEHEPALQAAQVAAAIAPAEQKALVQQLIDQLTSPDEPATGP